jgi:hypothetical protein
MACSAPGLSSPSTANPSRSNERGEGLGPGAGRPHRLLLAILLLRLFEERFVFFPAPSSASDRTPAQAGVQVEDVFITTSDGVKIHAWWAEAPGAARTILYFHGNAGNLSLRLPNIGWLQQLPANVLAVDYRGFGKSAGKPTEQGVYRDAEAAYDYLVTERKIPPEQIVVLGQSLGTAVAWMWQPNAKSPPSSSKQAFRPPSVWRGRRWACRGWRGLSARGSILRPS